MAKIYETRDPLVELRGPRESAPFQPVQAFDPSRAMLGESDRRLSQAQIAGNAFFQNQASDIKELTQFSETLGKYLVQKAEEKNKADYLRGLTGMTDGQTSIKPEVFEKHKRQELVLKQEAESETKIANQLSETNPAAGESFRHQSRAISGWEAYGQAVRKAQIEAGNSQAFFESYRKRNDEAARISISLSDGTVRSFTPAEAQTEEEIAAVMGAATNEFLLRSGLADLNPAIIAEHVLSRVDESKSTVAANWTKQMFLNQKEDRLSALDVAVSKALPNLTRESAPAIISKAFDDAFIITGNRAEANKFVQEVIFESLTALGQKDSNLAADVRQILSSTLINPNKPELGTLGDRFEKDFLTIDAGLKQSEKEQALEEEEGVKRRIEDILGAQLAAQQAGNLRQAQRSYDTAEKLLLDLGKTNPNEASAAILTLRGRQRNYSANNEKAILETIKDPDELSALLVQGYITQQGYDSVKDQIPSSDGKAKVNALRPELTNYFTSTLLPEVKISGLDPDGARALVKPIADQLAQELLVYGYDLETQARAAGKTMTVAALKDELIKRGLDQLKTNARFQFKVENNSIRTNLSGQVPFDPDDPKFGSSYVELRRGPTYQQLTNRALNKLPRVASAFAPSLDRTQIEGNIEAIRAGGKADDRVRILAAAADVSELDLLKTQAKPYGINTSNLDQSAAAKAYQANYALDPKAARILANPRSSSLQRQNAREALERSRNRNAYQTSYSDGKAFADLRTAIVSKEGGASGYNAANRGIAGDTPGGVPNLSSLNLQQVLSLYDSGSYNVLGGYQFKKTTLQALIRDTGIPLTSKFTPEVQDQLFESYFSRGSNNRTRLSNYVNGRSNDLRGAVEDLSLEFAAVRGMNGRGKYDGTAGNQAGLDASVLLRRIREERMGRGRPVDMTSRNIQSVRLETPGRNFQPGLDLWFADKRFGSVLPGTVKEIRRNNGNYGNMVVVESVDPSTNERVDVVYSHLDNISVAPGQRIQSGQLIGIQGGTGRVVSADGTIASVDFLAPAPRGSNSMTPYKYWKPLAERLRSQIQSGQAF